MPTYDAVNHTYEWPQLEFAALTSASGVQQSGTVVVRARQRIAADAVFPCIGKYEVRTDAHTARFCPAVVCAAGSSYVTDGSPCIDPHFVPLSPVSGGVTGASTVAVGSRGWAFFAYAREPPPALTLSTAAICIAATAGWMSQPLYAPLIELGMFTDDAALPLSIIVVKRDLEPGDELLVVFNQFDGMGRMYTYATPSPFARISAAVPLLAFPKAMQCVRQVLAAQASLSITDSYVKLLEDTAGTDSRTTERMHVAMQNLSGAVKHYIDSDGEVLPLPLVIPTPSTITHIMPPLKRAKVAAAKPTVSVVPMFSFPSSFRIPQSFCPSD
jgi:hypothetical protein